MASILIHRVCLGVLLVGASCGALAQVEVWSRQVSGVGANGAVVMAAPAGGGVYAAGQGRSVGGGAWVSRFDSEGAELWTRQIRVEGRVRIAGLAIDGGGTAYVTGTMGAMRANSPAEVAECFLWKLGPDGSLLWQRRFGTGGQEWSAALALDSAGAVLVAGSTSRSLGGVNRGGRDAFVRKYDGEGNLLWTRQSGTEQEEEFTALAVQVDGAVLAAGRTNGALGGHNAGGMDVFLLKLDASGQVMWARQWGSEGDDAARRMVLDAAGEICVAGEMGGVDFVEKLDGAGARLWVRKMDSGMRVTDVAADGLGGVLVTGREGRGSVFVRRFGVNGEEQQRDEGIVLGSGEVSGLALGRQGSVYVAARLAGRLGAAGGQEATVVIAKYGRPSAEDEMAGNSPSASGIVKARGTKSAAAGLVERSATIAGDTANGYIYTIAGTGTQGYSGDEGAGPLAKINGPNGVAVDSAGNVYIADTANHRIRKVNAVTGVISTVAGNGTAGKLGNGGAATSAQLSYPGGVAVDGAGNIFIADTYNQWVRRVDATSKVITVVAGDGTAGYSGDTGSATAAQLRYPAAVAVDGSGNIYVADSLNYRIRMVDPGTSSINTVAGNGTSAYSGDAGAATSASISYAPGVAVDGAKNIYIADRDNNRIRRVDAVTKTITTVAGNGTSGYYGDGGVATLAQVSNPTGVAVDSSGNLYVADYYNSRVRKVDAATQVITTIAGGNYLIGTGDGGPATLARLTRPWGVAVGGSKSVYVSDSSDHRVRFIDYSTPKVVLARTADIVGTGAGTGSVAFTVEPIGGSWVAQSSAAWLTPGVSGGTGGATLNFAFTANPTTMDRGATITVNGMKFTVEQRGAQATLSASVATVGAAAGSGSFGLTLTPSASWTATSSAAWLTVMQPSGSGNATIGFSYSANPGATARLATIVAGGQPFAVVQVGTTGAYTAYGATGRGNIITTAGDGTSGYGGNGGAATAAQIKTASTVVVDRSGNVFIADTGNQVVRKVDGLTGVITTYAGTGNAGNNGDGGLAIAADLYYPNALAADDSGNIYIGGQYTYRIRKVDAVTGVITTIAGNGTSGYSGDGGAATLAQLSETGGVAVDKSGNVYIGDAGNYRIRKVDVATGIIFTIAGTGTAGYTGDGGPATAAQIGSPRSIAVDRMGNLLFTDESVARIRKIDVTTGYVSPVALGIPSPRGLAVDSAGNAYFTGGSQVKRLDAVGGLVTSVAGDGTAGYFGDGGPANWSQLNWPTGLAVDGAGSVHIADTYNNRIRFIDGVTPKVTPVRLEDRVSAGGGVGSLAFTIEPAGSWWTAQSSASWAVITNGSGTGSGTLNYTFAPNPNLTQRQAILRINGIPFSVLQSPPQLNLALRSYTAGSGAGSGSLGLTVTPAVNWTASSSAAWLTVLPLSGSGNATLTFSFTANPGVNARMATIVVGGQQFSVLQMGTSGAYTPYGIVGRDNITTIAGTGTAGYSGDGGAATLAMINSPYTVAVEGSGNVYFPDSATHRVRKVDASTGNVSTVAGDGTRGSLGDGSPAIWARLDSPCAVAVDSGGNWFIVDSGNKRIRRVSASTGNITSIAGTDLAVCALAVDGAGSLYFADSRYQIQRMDLATGLTMPIAGNGTTGYSGDGGAALSAQMTQPGGLAVDGSGNVYIADSANSRVRMVSAVTGVITTVAGNGTYGVSGDGGLATAASLRYPRSLALDKAGNLYIADPQGYRVRKVTALTGVISTIAGSNGSGSTGDGGPATSAQLNGPNGVALDGTGNVYIGEAYGYRIRFVDVSLLATSTAVGTISPEPSTVGQAYSVAYTVTSGAGTPTGNVTVTDGTVSNTCTVAAGSCSLTSTSAGTKTITVTYAGGGNYSGSSGTKSHVVNADPLLVPDLTVSKTHTGNFAAGQVGATYTITVNNVGAGVTSGAVTVTDTLPAGLTASGIAGGGWNCTQPAGPCSRSDTLAAGSSYPAITLTVNVSPTAPALVTNIASVSGGGESNTANNQASDPTNTVSQTQFVSVTPCRIMDTRASGGFTGAFGPPSLVGMATRSIPVPSSSCGIPSTARAYSLNVTVVPKTGSLAYLTIWPTGQAQPNVSTLNSWDGSVLANAAIVPAGTGGAITVLATDNADLVIDINGYFGPPTASSLMFYPLTPCRVLDTRNATGTFGGPNLAAGVGRSFPLRSSTCGIPASAQSYSLNVTAVPIGPLGYLTTWPTGQAQPLVSTLNAMDGTVLANAAIVPAGSNGEVSFYASNNTHLVVDINGYFAPPGTGGLNFYTVTPCRILDSRNATGPFGGPIINGVETRAIPVRQSSCGVPSTAQAYSLNMTVVPPGFLGFLAVWPTGLSWSGVSTLNDYKGLAVANAALVPAGTNGAVNIYASSPSHVIMDINGYFGQ